jgi:hypothetical protein
MKRLHTSTRMILALVATTALTACADQGGMMTGGRVGPYGSSMGGGMMSGSSGGPMGMMQSDTKSMCEMYGQITHARSPEERAAMMDERMKGMSPEMKQQQMQMMEQRCK